jgi:DNA polymerase III subunit alpha
MKAMVLDTETTGLLPRDLTKVEEYPHIVQLSFRVYDTSTQQHVAHSFIVKPPVPIPPESTAVHGVTDDIANREGLSLRETLLHLALALEGCDELVGHNLAFDARVLECELDREGFVNVMSANAIQRYCTMTESRAICRIARRNKRTGEKYWKNPKLGELYTHLFNANVDGYHDAHVDTAATLRCYLKMRHNIDHAPQEFGICESF